MKNRQIILTGRLIDGTGGPVKKNMLIHVSDGYIEKITKAEPADFHRPEITDLSGHTVLPGLIDAHLHLFMSGTKDQAVREHQLKAGYDEMIPVISGHLEKLAEHGVIAVRDGGDYGGYAARYRNEFDCNIPVFVKVAGRAWRKKGRYGKLIGRALGENQSLAHAIMKENSCIDHVKIVNSGLNSLSQFGKETPPQFTLEELKAGVNAAREKGLKVMAHCNGKLPVEIAVKAGCSSVEHGFFMGRDNLKRMADMNTVWVPTAITMKAYSEQLEPGTVEADISRRNFEHQLEQISLARELGVSVALGTDSGSLGVYHGASVREELKILMQAGYSIEEAVRCAASNSAELLNLENIGKIALGMPAVFLAVKGEPTALPEGLSRVEIFRTDLL